MSTRQAYVSPTERSFIVQDLWPSWVNGSHLRFIATNSGHPHDLGVNGVFLQNRQHMPTILSEEDNTWKK